MELASLLAKAKAASPGDRIEWRDRIAAHGTEAIEGVRPWLSDPQLAAFAIRVIERAAPQGDAALAARVLRAARSEVPAAIVGDVDWAIQRLRTPSTPAASGSAPATPGRSAAPPRPQAQRVGTTARRKTARP